MVMRLRLTTWLAAFLVVTAPAAAQPKILTHGRSNNQPVNNGLPDRLWGFTFCRLRYDNVRRQRKSGWGDDYPNSDYNFMVRLEELTTVPLSRWGNGDPGFAQFRITDPDLFRCPFLRMQNAADYDFTDQEAVRLRLYLLKGGFLWEDDNWSQWDWDVIRDNLRRVLPEFAITDLTPEHPLFSTLYRIRQLPQIPSLNSWQRTGQPYEFGPENATPHYYAIFDDHQRLLVLVSLNSDVSDSWEREGDNADYFNVFGGGGYSLGVNVVLWVMSH
jgi:uncharacterized protein DUF4159